MQVKSNENPDDPSVKSKSGSDEPKSRGAELKSDDPKSRGNEPKSNYPKKINLG